MLRDSGRRVDGTDVDLLASARTGDPGAFAALTGPLHREIHLHCYRMLGSVDDADDAVQMTMLRAWRQITSFEPRAPFRAWLYKIATNVCLTLLTQRSRRSEVPASALPRTPGASCLEGEPMDLQPYPDRLLNDLAETMPGPEAIVEGRESVDLAFVAAVQVLPTRQRAMLLLRDVLGFPASEVAVMLETTVAAVNSAMQRARATLAAARTSGHIAYSHAPGDQAAEDRLVQQLIAAWHAADIAGIVSILTDDALLTMPPLPDRYRGADEIAQFLATVPGGGRLARFRLVPTQANRQPAVAAYYRDGDEGPYLAHAMIVLAMRDGKIASLTRLGEAALFSRFELADHVAGN